MKLTLRSTVPRVRSPKETAIMRPARHSEIDETISRGAGLHLRPAGRIGRQAHPAAVPRLSDSGAHPVGERFDRRRARKGTTLTTRSLAIGAESEIERVIVAAVEQRVRGDVAAWRAGTAYPRLCRPMVNRRDRAELVGRRGRHALGDAPVSWAWDRRSRRNSAMRPQAAGQKTGSRGSSC